MVTDESYSTKRGPGVQGAGFIIPVIQYAPTHFWQVVEFLDAAWAVWALKTFHTKSAIVTY